MALLHIENKNIININILILIIIFSIALGLRIFLRSYYLDDWDSVQFALALDNYSIAIQQPHPPGYPVYIFIGRIFNLFFNNFQQSLTFVSITFGALTVITTYYLGKCLFNEKTGLLAALLVSLSPATLLFSVVAMSDILSMFFITLTVLFLYLGVTNDKFLYIGASLLGLTIGIRQTNILLIPLFIFTVLYIKNGLGKIIFASLLTVVFICSWFIPLMFDTGFNNFILIYTSYGNHVHSTSTLNLLGGVNLINIVLTIKDLFSLFIEGWSISLFLFLVISLTFLIYLFYREPSIIKNYKFLFLVVWIVPYILYFIFDTYLVTSRFLLPIFPALALIFAFSIIESIKFVKSYSVQAVLITIVMGSIIFMGYQAIYTTNLLHVTTPAPIMAANFISDNYYPENCVIYGQASYRHFQYYLPEFTVFSGTTPDELYNFLIENKTIISEHEFAFGPHIYNEFYRDKKIYPVNDRVALNIYSPNTSAIYGIFGTGWYNKEMWENYPSYWIESNASLIIFSYQNQTIRMRFKAISFNHPKTLEISMRNHELRKEKIFPEKFTEIDLHLKLTEGVNEVKFYIPEGCERPIDISEYHSRDTRCLSLGVKNLVISEDTINSSV